MATLNQLQPIQTFLTPNEKAWFDQNAPHFLEALKLQQTVINQLVIRAGGSGPGTGIPNLDALTEQVNEIDAQADDTESWLGGVSTKAYKRYEFPDFSELDTLRSGVRRANSEAAKINQRLDEIESNRLMLGRILANQRAMMQKIEELEALWASSLAR
jgi:hypothetical protein